MDFRSLMSIEAILGLPWYVGELGLLLCALALWSSMLAMIQFRFTAAIVRLMFVFLILIILTNNGSDIVRFIRRIANMFVS